MSIWLHPWLRCHWVNVTQIPGQLNSLSEKSQTEDQVLLEIIPIGGKVVGSQSPMFSGISGASFAELPTFTPTPLGVPSCTSFLLHKFVSFFRRIAGQVGYANVQSYKWHHLVFQNACADLHSHQLSVNIPVDPHPYQPQWCQTSSFLPTWCKIVARVVLICIVLIINEVDLLFMC